MIQLLGQVFFVNMARSQTSILSLTSVLLHPYVSTNEPQNALLVILILLHVREWKLWWRTSSILAKGNGRLNEYETPRGDTVNKIRALQGPVSITLRGESLSSFLSLLPGYGPCPGFPRINGLVSILRRRIQKMDVTKTRKDAKK